MTDRYQIFNIRALLDKNSEAYIGETRANELLSSFSCPQNPDVEYFLMHNAIEFTKKDQAITYLVVDKENEEDKAFVGYFSIAMKPISVHANILSKTAEKKLARVSSLNESVMSYTTAAYLIAQLGKNYTIPKEKQIDGKMLLDFATDKILDLKYSLGGVMEFLECEDNEFLLDFYKSNSFKEFNTRVASHKSGDKYTLHQLLKLI